MRFVKFSACILTILNKKVTLLSWVDILFTSKCIGCGICTTKCEFDAIHLKRNRPQNSKMIPAEDKFKAIAPYAAKRQVKIIKKQLSGK